MSYRVLTGALLATISAGAGAQPAAGERLASPALAGFKVGYTAANTERSIREEVPASETVERWSRMVTTQRFVGLAQRTTPAAYARTIVGQLAQACPGARTSPIASITVSGRPASRLQVDCPGSAAGQSETFIMLAIAGRTDMHVKQVAWRGRVVPTDLAWGGSFLSQTVLCSGADKQPACR